MVGQSSRIVDYLFVVLMHWMWHCMFYRCSSRHKYLVYKKEEIKLTICFFDTLSIYEPSIVDIIIHETLNLVVDGIFREKGSVFL